MVENIGGIEIALNNHRILCSMGIIFLVNPLLLLVLVLNEDFQSCCHLNSHKYLKYRNDQKMLNIKMEDLGK